MMKTIDLFTDQELQEELNRRKEEATPKPKLSYTLRDLEERCSEYIDKLARGEGSWEDDDDEHEIFVVALEMIYGKDVMTWVNNQL